MRNTNLVTISLPPPMMREAEKIAKKEGMTRSELFRYAFRRYLEEMEMEKAIETAERELAAGKLKLLPKGGLARLIRGK